MCKLITFKSRHKLNMQTDYIESNDGLLPYPLCVCLFEVVAFLAFDITSYFCVTLPILNIMRHRVRFLVSDSHSLIVAFK